MEEVDTSIGLRGRRGAWALKPSLLANQLRLSPFVTTFAASDARSRVRFEIGLSGSARPEGGIPDATRLLRYDFKPHPEGP